MPGTFNGKTLRITATPTNGAMIPDDDNGTNVAGIAIINSDMYAVKTTGLKSALFKISAYTSAGEEAKVVKSGLNWFALGLSKIGDTLYMLAAQEKKYTKDLSIVEMSTSGNLVNAYAIESFFEKGALGIAHTGNPKEFFVLGYGAKDDADTQNLTVKRINCSSGKAVLKETFTVANKGFGYTYQLQDIYYHTDYGLFIITNNTFGSASNATLQNRILVVDYKEGTAKYTPSAVIDVNLSEDTYTQYNLESICMKANHLVLAANIVKKDGVKAVAEDRFSVLNGITYANGTYSFNCGVAKGMKVPHGNAGGISTTNFGTIAFDNDAGHGNTLYAIKAGTKKDMDYKDKDVCGASVYTLGSYTSASSTAVDEKYTVEPNESICLFHANGMDYYNNNLYIACAENEKAVLNKNYPSIVRLGTTNWNAPSAARFYTQDGFRANAISHFSGDKFMVLSDSDPLSYNSRPVYKLYVGRCTGGEFTKDETYYFCNTGYSILQDIYYTAKYGLFVVTCDIVKMANNEYQTRHSKVLHLNMNRTITYEGNRLIIPDFAFNNDLNTSEYFSFEMESVAIDPRTNNMIVSVNANNPNAGSDGLHKGEDYIYRLSTIKFE